MQYESLLGSAFSNQLSGSFKNSVSLIVTNCMTAYRPTESRALSKARIQIARFTADQWMRNRFHEILWNFLLISAKNAGFRDFRGIAENRLP